MIKNKYTVVLSSPGDFKVLKIQEVPFKVKGTTLTKANKIKEELNNA